MAETLAVARRLAPQLGITVCNDATSFDLLGVPVWFSHRGQTVDARVHSGKGTLAIEAHVGALMEAIENAVAERAGERFCGGRAVLGDLVAAFDPRLTVADLSPRLTVTMPAERVVAVETCEDIASGTIYSMPAELLHQTLPELGREALVFGMSSNGLASGNSLDEATLHALLEVLERDAVAMDMARSSASPLMPGSLPKPFAEWQSRWLGLGVELRLRALPNLAELPCVAAELIDRSGARAPRGLGFGLHPDPYVALSRAVTEAAQSRLYQLRFKADANADADARSTREAVPAPASHQPALRFDELQGTPCDNVALALQDVVSRLRARGLHWVLRRRLNQHSDASDLDGLHVVKVLVPGCESSVGNEVRIGRRLARRLSGLD